jgi:hypothetical protein
VLNDIIIFIKYKEGGLAQSEERVVRNDEAPGSKPGFSIKFLLINASMAQLAEHSAVNRRVPGSSPGGSVYSFYINYIKLV